MNINDLEEYLKNNKNQQIINLSAKQITDEGISLICNFINDPETNITELNLSVNNISHLGAKLIADALKVNKTLTSLNLSDNYIRNKGVKYLADALGGNKKLTSLDLSDSGISDEGANYLAKALHENKTLTSLALSDNSIGDKGAKYLADALKKNKKLTSLYLSENIIGDEGADYFVHALRQEKSLTREVRELINRVDNGEIKNIRINNLLTHLDLTNNEICDNKLLQRINDYIQENKQLVEDLVCVLQKVFIPNEKDLTLNILKFFQVYDKVLLQQYTKLDDQKFNDCVKIINQYIVNNFFVISKVAKKINLKKSLTKLKLKELTLKKAELKEVESTLKQEEHTFNPENNATVGKKRKLFPPKFTKNKACKVEDTKLQQSEEITPNHPFTDPLILSEIVSYLSPATSLWDIKIETQDTFFTGEYSSWKEIDEYTGLFNYHML